MKRYPAYKDSWVEWFGDIPEHWSINKLFRLAFIQEGPGLRNWQFTDEGVRVICVTNITDRGIDFSYQKFISEEEYNKTYQHFTVNKGDLLLSSSGNSWGKVAEYNGDKTTILNTSTIRLNCNNNNSLSRKLLKWVLQTDFTKEQLSLMMTGSCQPNFGPTHLKQLIIPVPKEIEQNTIAEYLDHKTRLIDILIEKKQKQIELLLEQRTGIINHAVTKGLNPNVKMKDTGIEWLGEVPEHWAVKPFKYACNIAEGQVNPTESDFKEVILIAPNHIESGTGKLALKETADEQGAISGKYRVKCGDVVYSKIRPALNKVCIADQDCLCSADMYPIKTTPIIFSKFLLYFMLSETFVRFMVNESMRVAMPKINRDTLNNYRVPVPPLDEQSKIINELDRQTNRIFNLYKILGNTISQLKEYRTTLISEVVTGKIDVRDEVIP